MPDASVYEQMSDLERKVYNFLTRKNILFNFQSHLIGGFGNETGDTKVDFVLPDRNILFRVQGTYWHTGTELEAKDLLQKERLTALGYIVIDLWQEDLEYRFEDTMRKALVGESMPK